MNKEDALKILCTGDWDYPGRFYLKRDPQNSHGRPDIGVIYWDPASDHELSMHTELSVFWGQWGEETSEHTVYKGGIRELLEDGWYPDC